MIGAAPVRRVAARGLAAAGTGHRAGMARQLSIRARALLPPRRPDHAQCARVKAGLTSLVSALAITLASGGPVHGDVVHPWSAGVGEPQKAHAQALLDQGNARFLEHEYAGALASYQQALAAWNHPAIRVNIVRCLVQLDRPVEASDMLQAALAFGAEPLQDTVYDEALGYRKLLASLVGALEVTCTQPGVTVSLDGQVLTACPAAVRRTVAAGPHQLVGVAPGWLTRTFDVSVFGGSHAAVAMTLRRLSDVAVVSHRWPQWIPWVVLGGGVAIAGIGTMLDLRASSDMAGYERAIAHDCPTLACPPAMVDDGLRARAVLENRIATGIVVTGAAAAGLGITLLYMNRGRTIYPPDGDPRAPRVVQLEVSPRRGGAIVGLSAAF